MNWKAAIALRTKYTHQPFLLHIYLHILGSIFFGLPRRADSKYPIKYNDEQNN
jgi:hypothetical protein